MLYLSRLLGSRVYAQESEGSVVLGRLEDVVIQAGQSNPLARGFILRGRRGDAFWVPSGQLLPEADGRLVVRSPQRSIRLFLPETRTIRLGLDVLDKQVIDIMGHKVVRVNDVQVAWAGEALRIVAVDVGWTGFLQRLGLGGLVGLLRRLGFHPRERVIPWALVEPLGSPASPLKLSIAWNKLRGYHPADLASLLPDLDPEEQVALLRSLDLRDAAEVVSRIEEAPLRRAILERLPKELASDLLERMAPDDAADVLAELPRDDQEAIVGGMEKAQRSDVERLMRYGPHSAGGLMTTDFIAFPERLTAQEAIDRLRVLAPDAETIYYLYVVAEDGRLVGTLTLRDLIVAPPDRPLGAVMHRRVISVPLEADEERVVDVMAHYDFLALPVVDDEGRLQGIITYDDVMDVVLERGGWKRRLRARD
ncbi:MAG: CBS domain-containing protein [Firmicutes bacterium]|nr:CBS domain-containing protein [Bacillota bacterium]